MVKPLGGDGNGDNKDGSDDDDDDDDNDDDHDHDHDRDNDHDNDNDGDENDNDKDNDDVGESEWASALRKRLAQARIALRRRISILERQRRVGYTIDMSINLGNSSHFDVHADASQGFSV